MGRTAIDNLAFLSDLCSLRGMNPFAQFVSLIWSFSCGIQTTTKLPCALPNFPCCTLSRVLNRDCSRSCKSLKISSCYSPAAVNFGFGFDLKLTLLLVNPAPFLSQYGYWAFLLLKPLRNTMGKTKMSSNCEKARNSVIFCVDWKLQKNNNNSMISVRCNHSRWLHER